MKYLALVLSIAGLLGGCTRETTTTEVPAAADPATTMAASDTNPPQVEPVATGRFRNWGPYLDYDVNRDKKIDRTEFDTRVGEMFGGWDADRNQTLSREELSATWRDLWDGNDDDFIDENEWSRATRAWTFKDRDYGTYDTWDTNRDGRVNNEEFDSRMITVHDIFDPDKNQSVKGDEFADTWWDLFDGNNDDFIDEEEWRTRTWS